MSVSGRLSVVSCQLPVGLEASVAVCILIRKSPNGGQNGKSRTLAERDPSVKSPIISPQSTNLEPLLFSRCPLTTGNRQLTTTLPLPSRRGEECFAHQFSGRRLSEPDLEREDSLMEQHQQAVRGSRSLFPSETYQRRFLRPINHVKNQMSRFERIQRLRRRPDSRLRSRSDRLRGRHSEASPSVPLEPPSLNYRPVPWPAPRLFAIVRFNKTSSGTLSSAR